MIGFYDCENNDIKFRGVPFQKKLVSNVEKIITPI